MKKTIIFGVLICFTFILGFLSNSLIINSQEDEVFRILLKSQLELSENSIASQRADSYYDLASLNYEDENFQATEYNCKIARNYFFEESQGYRKIKAEIQSYEIEDELIDIFVDSLDSQIDISLNMFEACEYFETASRSYDKYYYADGDDADFDSGTNSINMMNEKIEAHDKAVGRYNNLLEEFRVKLKQRIEK